MGLQNGYRWWVAIGYWLMVSGYWLRGDRTGEQVTDWVATWVMVGHSGFTIWIGFAGTPATVVATGASRMRTVAADEDERD